jgi:hypothetical protein
MGSTRPPRGKASPAGLPRMTNFVLAHLAMVPESN